MGDAGVVRCRVCLREHDNRAAATACYESHNPVCDWCGAPVEHLFSNECDAWREKRDAQMDDDETIPEYGSHAFDAGDQYDGEA